MRRLNTSRAIRQRLWRRGYIPITIRQYRLFQAMKRARATAKRDANAQASGENANGEWVWANGGWVWATGAPATGENAEGDWAWDEPATGENAEGDWAWDAPVTGENADGEWEDPQAPVGTPDSGGSCDAPGNGAQRPRGRPFPKGVSGNPAGRPAGSRNRTTRLAEAMIGANAQHIMARVIIQAIHGEAVAQKILVPQILATGRKRPIELELPKSTNELKGLPVRIMRLAFDGEITMEDAKLAMDLVKSMVDVTKYLNNGGN